MIFKLARSDPLMIEKYQNRTIRLPLTTWFSDLNNAGSSGRSSEVFFLNMEDGFFGCQVRTHSFILQSDKSVQVDTLLLGQISSNVLVSKSQSVVVCTRWSLLAVPPVHSMSNFFKKMDKPSTINAATFQLVPLPRDDGSRLNISLMTWFVT